MPTRLRNAVFGLFVLSQAMVWMASAGYAAPLGYSVNSDEPDGDRLYQIDLATGSETEIGTVQSFDSTLRDVEGLALDSSGTLWGVDDASLKLFPISTSTGMTDLQREVTISGLDATMGNDFGLTFTCADELFASSVANQMLYRLSLDGTATEVGSLGENISALAAWGNPARLYGLGNGKLGDGQPDDNRSLYEINTVTGATTLIGKVGKQAADYFEAGLSFDTDGTLWALTDRWTLDNPQGSQVLSLNLNNGKATLHSTTTITGFEALAVAAPSGCNSENSIIGDWGNMPMEGIPTLGAWGKLLAFLLLGALGIAALRGKRIS